MKPKDNIIEKLKALPHTQQRGFVANASFRRKFGKKRVEKKSGYLSYSNTYY
ncbi:MAG: hypothetical protein JKY33_01615 [Bacteroidia bacterium]|nr:hypothetical protein [Bacteroidia bacterium]